MPTCCWGRWAISATGFLNRLSTDTQKDTGARMYMAIIHRNSRVLGDRNVRRALSLALDRETFGRNLFGKTAPSRRHIIPDGISGYVADASVVNPTPRTYEDRLDPAKELIAGSGYDASNPIRIRLIYASQVNGYREIASFLKASWKNIHVDLAISTVEDFWKSIDIFNKSSYDVVISSTFDEMPLNYLNRF
ncbi:MAG: ABC transporter substrate-binding protein [Geminicoccaceae bacterium]